MNNNKQLAEALFDIAYNAVTVQKEYTIEMYKIIMEDNTTNAVGIWKSKNRYEITVNGYNAKIVERSNNECLIVLLTIYNLLKEVENSKLLKQNKIKKVNIDNNHNLQPNDIYLSDMTVFITYKAVKEQKMNTTGFYTVDIADNKKIVITINKEEDKYKITLNGDRWRIVKKSEVESVEILLIVNDLLTQAQKQLNNK